MDITPYIGTIATVIIAFLSFYGMMASRFSRMEEKVDNLVKQVEKHNNVVERTAKVEGDLNTAFKRIDELKARDDKIEGRIEKLHEKE